MNYECKKLPLQSLMKIGHEGIIEPLCETCKSQDCSNPIQKRTVSVFGLNKPMRLYAVGDDLMVVVKCMGHVR